MAPITDHPLLTRKAWRVGQHVLEIGVSVHTVVLRLPDNGRNLVAPGCVECRALPHFALWCAAKVRDFWRRGLRIPYPPPLIFLCRSVSLDGVKGGRDFSSKQPGHTRTETSRFGRYSAIFGARTSPSSSAVRPMAGTSFRNGSEILPSDLTGTVLLIASFFHTEIRSKASAPIRDTSAAPLRQRSRSEARAA